MAKRIALVLKGYPRLSETFIAQEIRELEKHGLDILLVSLRHPTDSRTHPIHDEIQARVLYLPEYLYVEPWRVLSALLRQLTTLSFWRTAGIWWKDLMRDISSNRVRRFGQALVLANELPKDVELLYAHFIHTPGSVTRYCSELTTIDWCASAHAKDIWTTPRWELQEKLASLSWLTTCTAANTEYLKGLCDDEDKVFLSYHGLDFSRFPEPETSVSEAAENGTVQVLSVGRAVPKKGYDLLLNALASLPVELEWHFTHIGGGELLPELEQLSITLGIQNRVTWLGAQSQQRVLEAYQNSDLFVLASRVNGDGDRDGLPNVLMEAQSQKLACLSTDISGIPELIIDGESGLLVPQKDEAALADALHRLMADYDLRQRLGRAGYQRVRSHFSLDEGIDQLMGKFGGDA
ncbi:glycosyltransferase family 4 protein [Aestuariirhabdus sp. Z084]|uniref:glycosyltransferase family 4 protein n=1 Tax=Aestuariirhabdus haliotis TaxID=2918751 RepID=UPI00201B3E9E|nr:glycosyltransferase family 4 protein [Aestuariirhabdus haliotis]MCL6414840.1 glycosyltransferase family 4 protein [Aestuariirhabdus haliotis]MCL6418772.1 glycosyltransferase family 4 protein [Aestuariirhabdus haliotis]